MGSRHALTAALLLAIVALGAGLRFHAIGTKSLWLDETASLELAGRPVPDLIRECAHRDTHPPLYYLMLHVWLWGSDGAAQARALSALIGTATLVAFYALLRQFLGRAASLIGTLVLAASAYQVYFAQEARHYALSAFLVVLGWVWLGRMLATGRGRWPWWLALALTNAAALYTFYYDAFAIAAQLVVLLVLWRDGGRKLLARWCAWNALAAILFSPYAIVIVKHIRALGRFGSAGRSGAVGLRELAVTGAQFTGGFSGELLELAGRDGARPMLALAGVGLAVVAVGLVGLKRRRQAVVVALSWLLVPLAITIVFPFKGHVYEPKHLIFAAPALAALVAIGFAALRGKAKAIAVALAALVVAANAASLTGYYSPRVSKENWRDLMSRLAQKANEGDIVIFNPGYITLPYLYYYKPDRIGHPCPRLEGWETPPGGPPLSESKQRALAQGRRAWVIYAASNVAYPNRKLPDEMAAYRVLYHEQYRDLVGLIDLKLYDTAQPAAAP